MATTEPKVHLADRFYPELSLCGLIPVKDGDVILSEAEQENGSADCPNCLGDGED